MDNFKKVLFRNLFNNLVTILPLGNNMIKKVHLLEEIKKLKRKIFIFENIGVSINSSIKEKEVAAKMFIENNPSFTPYEVCTTISLNRGTFYNFLHNKVEKPWFTEKEEMVTKEVIKIFKQSRQLYGQNKIAIVLRKKGIIVTPEKVSEIMKKNNLIKATVIKKPERALKRSGSYHRKNLVLGRFNPECPNMLWASDFLELKVGEVKYYLCVVLDLYARYVVAWRISHKLSDNFALNTLKDAFENRNEPKNLIFHTDQGAEFTSHRFMDSLKAWGISQSFSAPHSPHDNAVMESFYNTLRREETNVHIYKYENSLIIKEYLSSYFDYYNNERLHLSIGEMTPAEKEKMWFESHK